MTANHWKNHVTVGTWPISSTEANKQYHISNLYKADANKSL